MVSSIPSKPVKSGSNATLSTKQKASRAPKKSRIVSKVQAISKDLGKKQKRQLPRKRVSKATNQFSKLLQVVRRSLAKLVGKRSNLSKEEKKKLLKYKA